MLVLPCTMARAARHENAVRSMSIDLRCLENSTISSIQGPKLTSTWLRWRTQPLSNRKRSSVSRLILKQENVEFHPIAMSQKIFATKWKEAHEQNWREKPLNLRFLNYLFVNSKCRIHSLTRIHVRVLDIYICHEWIQWMGNPEDRSCLFFNAWGENCLDYGDVKVSDSIIRAN